MNMVAFRYMLLLYEIELHRGRYSYLINKAKHFNLKLNWDERKLIKIFFVLNMSR